MKTRLTQSIPTVLTLAAVGFSHFSLWCTGSGHLCYRTWLDSIFVDIINPLYFFALYLLPIAVILMFVPRNTFNSWLKFAVWAIPLSAIFIATTPVNWTGIGMDFFPFYRDDAARFAAEVFTVVTLIIIAWKYIVSRRANSAKT